ncbi:Aldehyde dehydrogenase [Aphelenchoides besseyi]|nr:Aldehyde dehydrogenase [Aphelenchoides besseyi]
MSIYKELIDAQREFVHSGAPHKLETRRSVLKKLRDLLVTHEAQLTKAVYKDLRREARTTFVMEISGALMEIDYCLQNLDEWAKPECVQRTLSTMLDTPMIYKDPYGVVFLLSPWNYSLYMIFLPLVTILAAGNTVIIKPSEVSSATSQIIYDLFTEYFDSRHIAVIQTGIEGTTALLRERFDFIMYTGNQTVGKIVMEAAAKHTTPLVLELGGKCPAIVLPDADIGITARRIAWGKWTNNGQTCIAPDYVLITESVRDRLVAELRNALTEFYGSDCQASKDYSRIINERHFDRLNDLIKHTNGKLVHIVGDLDRKDLFIPPHIFEVEENDVLLKDEIFGPILPILVVDNLTHAIEYINSKEKPLASYIFTRDDRSVAKMLTTTRSGAVTVNDVVLHIAVDTLPFGGVGASGFGCYHGKWGFDQFTHKKAVLKRGFFGEGLAACRYPPMTDSKLRQLKQLSKRRSLPSWLIHSFWPFVYGIFVALVAVWTMQIVSYSRN